MPHDPNDLEFAPPANAVPTSAERGKYFWRMTEYPGLGLTRGLYDPDGNWLCWTDPRYPVAPTSTEELQWTTK